MRGIHERKRLRGKEHLLDHMGGTELLACWLGTIGAVSWASVTLKRTAAMEEYRWEASEGEGRGPNGE